ncbi:hypothetical protein [Streptomyces sp. NPDC098781]|uniref:hypothetical protein n=1 Tax=Streptomyces sp. NPDC098781 TaxID=3366097 RepID=UPI00381D7D96
MKRPVVTVLTAAVTALAAVTAVVTAVVVAGPTPALVTATAPRDGHGNIERNEWNIPLTSLRVL